MFLNKDLKKKLILISSATILGIVVFLTFFFFNFSNSLKNARKNEFKEHIEMAIKSISYFYELEISGVLSEEMAKKYAMGALEKETYGKSGYYWIHRSDGLMLMLPYFPDLVGTNFSEKKDSNGLFFNKEMTKVAKQGGGIVEYYWENPHTHIIALKASSVGYFEPWDWVVGTGVFSDELDKEVLSVIIKSSGFTFIVFLLFSFLLLVTVNKHTHQTGIIANSDPLTGLFSKRSMPDIISQIEQQYRTKSDKLFTAMFMDLDDFKTINETLGHKGGDDILNDIAALLKNLTRAKDYCIRFGGDEFVLISKFNTKEDATKLAERIRFAVSKLSYVSDNDDVFKVTVSIGIAIYNEHDDSFSEVLARADKKLFESKNLGKNIVYM